MEKNSCRKTRKQNYQTHWSQHEVKRHRTRRTSLQYQRWPNRTSRARHLALQIWYPKNHIQSTSGHNNHIGLPREPSMIHMAHIYKPSRILIEQDSDPALLNFTREMLGLPFDDQVLLNKARYIHYSRIRKRIIFKDDILNRQYNNEVGDSSYLKLKLIVQTLATLLKPLHGGGSKRHGIDQMMQEIRRRYYFPSIAKNPRNWVHYCETCSKSKRINTMKLRPEIIKVLEWDLGPEDTMRTDLLSALPSSGGYENVVTATDVISRKAFAYPVSTPLQ